jgi:hypothetical protein
VPLDAVMINVARDIVLNCLFHLNTCIVQVNYNFPFLFQLSWTQYCKLSLIEVTCLARKVIVILEHRCLVSTESNPLLTKIAFKMANCCFAKLYFDTDVDVHATISSVSIRIPN